MFPARGWGPGRKHRAERRRRRGDATLLRREGMPLAEDVDGEDDQHCDRIDDEEEVRHILNLTIFAKTFARGATFYTHRITQFP